MQNVAVITGAASGIGRGLAERFAAEGMKVVIADVEEDSLAELESDLKAKGATVLAVKTDVSNAKEVEDLAARTLDTFGGVHILCNNAGVVCSRPIWEHTLTDWEWVLGVNLWGVIHGVREFVPRMLAQGDECHIVNTASILGLVGGSGEGIYKVSKHGVVVLSETLADELAQKGAKIQVHVLCPGWVCTGILDSARNRPDTLQNPRTETPLRQQTIGGSQNARAEMEAGLSPAEVADHVYEAIQNGTFYIHTHPEHKAWIRERMERILE
jgi:NAD(P)-dependent dehydrogenase (short-subunit alcohol dehydrogenase family)